MTNQDSKMMTLTFLAESSELAYKPEDGNPFDSDIFARVIETWKALVKAERKEYNKRIASAVTDAMKRAERWAIWRGIDKPPADMERIINSVGWRIANRWIEQIKRERHEKLLTILHQMDWQHLGCRVVVEGRAVSYLLAA